MSDENKTVRNRKMCKIGDIQFLADKCGLSLKDLAENIGYSRSVSSSWINTGQVPETAVWAALGWASESGIDISDLISKDEQFKKYIYVFVPLNDEKKELIDGFLKMACEDFYEVEI